MSETAAWFIYTQTDNMSDNFSDLDLACRRLIWKDSYREWQVSVANSRRDDVSNFLSVHGCIPIGWCTTSLKRNHPQKIAAVLPSPSLRASYTYHTPEMPAPNAAQAILGYICILPIALCWTSYKESKVLTGRHRTQGMRKC